MMADVNGDGLSDAVLFVPATGILSVALALGDGRFSSAIQTDFIAGGTPDGHWFLMVDMNGDGKADAVKYDPSTGSIFVALSHGDGNFNSPLTVPFLAGGTPADRWFRVADINGDGYPDAVLHVPGSNKVQVLSSSRQVLDVVNAVTNGLGITTTVTYKPLTDASVYAKDSTAVYPYVELQAPMYVAASVSTSDGTGGNAVTNYTYAGAKSHQLGGGFLGFRQVSAHDSQAHIRSVTTYRQNYPYHGQPLSSQKFTDSGVLLSQSTITYADQLLNTGLSPTWHQSLPTHTVESSYELTGGLISTVITDTQYDTWGNPTSIVVNSGAGYSKTTTNTYDNIVDGNRWLLGRLRRSTVNSVTP